MYHSAYLFLVSWHSCWATSYLGVFSPLFIFLVGPACICTCGSNSVLCGLCVTFLSSYEISVTGRTVNVWETEMNLGTALKKEITILRAWPLPVWAQCPKFYRALVSHWSRQRHMGLGLSLALPLKKSGRKQRESTETQSSFTSISNKNWDQEHVSPTGDGCYMLKKGLWCPVYLLLHVRLYPKLLRCVPIFARKDQDNFNLMAPLHSPFGQICVAFSSFLWHSKRVSKVQGWAGASSLSFWIAQWYLPHFKF